MADEKKPVDGTEDNAEVDAAKSPETELTPETASGTVVTEDEDAKNVTGDEAETSGPGEDTVVAEGLDTVSAGDETLPVGADTIGDETLTADADTVAIGDDTVTGDDRVAPGDETVTGDDTISDDAAATDASGLYDDDRIHSAGEATLLSEEATVAGPDATETPAEDTPGTRASEPVVAPAPVVQERVVERKGGFGSALIGGVIAAALGYGAAAYQNGGWPFAGGGDTFQEETTAALSEQTARIDALADEVKTATDTANGIDLSGLEGSVGELQGQIDTASGNFDGLSGRLDELAGRIDALERKPVEESVSPEAMAAYENELNLLRDAIAQQRLEVEQMTQQALEAEANAEGQAALAKARAALSEVTAALTDGEPYAEPLGTMQENGVTVPDALAAPASEGVPTLSALVEEYPPLARDALSAARMAESETEGGTERFATFLSNQLGVRSVTPREGDTADAVLSRAEAALRSGDLPAALSELGTLPDEARAPLADWISRAQTRADAVAAADAVSLELNKE